MFSVASIETTPMPPHGTLVAIASPVECDRGRDSMSKAFGDSIEIDGEIFKIKSIQRSLILSPIQVGEIISILV